MLSSIFVSSESAARSADTPPSGNPLDLPTTPLFRGVRNVSMAARPAAAGESRFKSYKTKGLDVEEVRRRKEEEGLQLRKSRREEQVSLKNARGV